MIKDAGISEFQQLLHALWGKLVESHLDFCIWSLVSSERFKVISVLDSTKVIDKEVYKAVFCKHVGRICYQSFIFTGTSETLSKNLFLSSSWSSNLASFPIAMV